jgi:hypothetical protein
LLDKYAGNPLIVRNFPIAGRDNELGIETPIPIYPTLIKANHSVKYDKDLVIKGFYSMLVSIEFSRISVQWHLLSNNTGIRIRYNEVKRQCPLRLDVTLVKQHDLLNTRAFIGWCDKSESYLGPNQVAYGDIAPCGAGRPGRGIEINGFPIGFSKIATGTLNFAIGYQDLPIFMATPSHLEMILNSTDEMPICLYDIATKRAWLVSGTEVILYLIHIKHERRPYLIEGKSALTAHRLREEC